MAGSLICKELMKAREKKCYMKDEDIRNIEEWVLWSHGFR